MLPHKKSGFYTGKAESGDEVCAGAESGFTGAEVLPFNKLISPLISIKNRELLYFQSFVKIKITR